MVQCYWKPTYHQLYLCQFQTVLPKDPVKVTPKSPYRSSFTTRRKRPTLAVSSWLFMTSGSEDTSLITSTFSSIESSESFTCSEASAYCTEHATTSSKIARRFVALPMMPSQRLVTSLIFSSSSCLSGSGAFSQSSWDLVWISW